MNRLIVSCFFLLFSIPTFSQSQSALKDSVASFTLLHIHYGLNFPLADMSDRFGLSNALGAGFGVKTRRNAVIGCDGSYLFSRNVKETDILKNITGESGSLISTSGLLATYTFSQKGFLLQMQGGKIIPFKKPNVNSGLMLLAGAGYLQHKIHIEVNDAEVPMLSKEYKKGYDRLTSGFMLSQFIGYFFVDAKHKRINCYAGVEITEAFTKNRRSWNFDEQRKDDKARKDIFVSLKFGWVIPFYRSQTEKFYYY